MQIEKIWLLDFPRDAVYRAWVSSETVIPPATAMDIDAVVGGHYRLYVDTPDFSGFNEGRFSCVEPYRRVTYTWAWKGDTEVTTIDVQFDDTKDGTRVNLVHSGFVGDDSRINHDQGWDAYIEGFAEFLKNRN